MNVPKERTLQGLHKGKALFLGHIKGEPVVVTVWDGILQIARDQLPHKLVHMWRGLVVIGGYAWWEIPHPMTKDPRIMYLYPDTFGNLLLWPNRKWMDFRERIREIISRYRGKR